MGRLGWGTMSRMDERGLATDRDAPRVQVDVVSSAARSTPLDDLTPRALNRLARRADRLRHRDVTGLADLAREHDVQPRQLRMLADAWQEGGPTGVQMLGPAVAAEPETMHRAEAVVERWRRSHFPLDALESEVWRNRLTVWWLVPGQDRTGDLERLPLLQVRRSRDGRWHLYRRAVQGEWWPVTVRGRRRRQSLSDCLDAVRIDPLRHFWGVDGPPQDLADDGWMPDPPHS